MFMFRKKAPVLQATQLERSHVHAVKMCAQLSERQIVLERTIDELQEELRQNNVVLSQYTMMRDTLDAALVQTIDRTLDLNAFEHELTLALAD